LRKSFGEKLKGRLASLLENKSVSSEGIGTFKTEKIGDLIRLDFLRFARSKMAATAIKGVPMESPHFLEEMG
jgi:hypothetical protein